MPGRSHTASPKADSSVHPPERSPPSTGWAVGIYFWHLYTLVADLPLNLALIEIKNVPNTPHTEARTQEHQGLPCGGPAQSHGWPGPCPAPPSATQSCVAQQGTRPSHGLPGLGPPCPASDADTCRKPRRLARGAQGGDSSTSPTGALFCGGQGSSPGKAGGLALLPCP